MKIVKVISCWNAKIGFVSTGTIKGIRPFPLHLIYSAEDSEEGQNSKEQHSRDPSVCSYRCVPGMMAIVPCDDTL